MSEMSNKIRASDRNINTLNGNVRKLNQQLNDMRSQLEGKIDRA